MGRDRRGRLRRCAALWLDRYHRGRGQELDSDQLGNRRGRLLDVHRQAGQQGKAKREVNHGDRGD
jgi:hypothetical protein